MLTYRGGPLEYNICFVESIIMRMINTIWKQFLILQIKYNCHTIFVMNVPRVCKNKLIKILQKKCFIYRCIKINLTIKYLIFLCHTKMTTKSLF